MILKSIVNQIIFILILLYSFVLISFYNLLLFHSLAEFTSIVIGLSVLLIVLPINRRINNHFIYWIGVSFIFVSLFDLVHTITYKGMNILDEGNDIPLQLWIIARFWQSLALLLGFTGFKGKFNKLGIIITQSILFLLVIFMIFKTDLFPICYIEGQGVTLFKIVSEAIVCFILLISIVFFFKHKSKWDQDLYRYFSVSLFILFLSELTFCFFSDFFDVTDVIGHLLKILSTMLFYIGVYKSVITKPFNLLYEDVNKLNFEKEVLKKDLEESKMDEMTGTFNRNHYNEFVENFDVSKFSSVGLIIVDIDNMKYINDHFGHLEGDRVIKLTSEILKKQLRKDDEVFRYGGDEFVIIIKDENEEVMRHLNNRIEKKFKEINESSEVEMSVSCGYNYWSTNDSNITFEELFSKADANMYINKKGK